MSKDFSTLSNTKINEFTPLITPEEIRKNYPLEPDAEKFIQKSRKEIRNALNGIDKRLVVIVGPCSIHDPEAGLEYAEKLAKLNDRISDNILIIMRVYFEKPRTTVGWKGLLNDPSLNGTHDIETGIQKCRKLLIDVAKLKLPAATEFLDPIFPQYSADLVSWTAIGARTTESQTHREMASGLSMPVGFKNATDGGLQVALDAIISAQHAHSFLGIDEAGRTSIIKTTGNEDVHIILRGGTKPNYDPETIQTTIQKISTNIIDRRVMVDCSHGNSNKDYRKQPIVFENVVNQYLQGNKQILGLMLESNLLEGNQKLSDEPLIRGKSITDGCVSWETTEELLIKTNKKMT